MPKLTKRVIDALQPDVAGRDRFMGTSLAMRWKCGDSSGC
jgi:hypothetical protein